MCKISVNSWFNQNMKTKPKQTQNKPKQSQFFGGFWRKNFNFSPKIDDTKLNLLCKTKPNSVIGIQIAVEYDLPKNIKNTKQSQFENCTNGRKYSINKRLQQKGHLVSWEKQSQFKANLVYPAPTSRLYRKVGAVAFGRAMTW